ncbi:GatB/YqeY domain-containing protein [Siphonobacter sp.]|uniref:GatB/YqeY domain-containing protein n=1 Tax=Siphonobacter sp. TaxID=1869184 RepID=UPI003B3B7FF3
MSLKSTIEAQIKSAMLAKNQARLLALRAIKSAILLEETAGTAHELTPEQETKILMKAVKQRKDSAETYVSNGRQELADKEYSEIAVIEEFLPKMLTEEELKARLQEIITRVGATGPSDLGKVMGVATKELAGLAEGKTISATVKQLLS